MSFNNNSLRFPPGFGHGRGHEQSGQAPELGGGIYAGWGSGQGRETIGGFPVGQGLQGPGGLRGLIAGGLEGGYQDASMRKYLGGGGGELASPGHRHGKLRPEPLLGIQPPEPDLPVVELCLLLADLGTVGHHVGKVV